MIHWTGGEAWTGDNFPPVRTGRLRVNLTENSGEITEAKRAGVVQNCPKGDAGEDKIVHVI